MLEEHIEFVGYVDALAVVRIIARNPCHMIRQIILGEDLEHSIGDGLLGMWALVNYMTNYILCIS